MNTLWSMWNNGEVVKLPNTGYTIKGFSIAALRTNFYIPELKLMLDSGLSANVCPETILVTHCHSDHVANLPYHLYTATNDRRITIFAPAENYQRINRYILSAHSMSVNTDPETDADFQEKMNAIYEMIPAYPGRTEILIGGQRSMGMEVIPCDHTVPSIGFGLLEKRLKLKPEYANLAGKELGQLKKSGVDINYEIELPFFLYLGDTSEKVLLDERILKYRTIMIECTFLLEEEFEQATITKHMHWKHLYPFVQAHQEIYFILYHFSQRYKPEEIKAFFEPIQQEMSNFHVWISS